MSSTTRASFWVFCDSSSARADGTTSAMISHAPLGFADDLLRDDKDIVVLQFDFCFLQGLKQNIRQVVILADKGNVLEWGEG